MTVAQIVKKYLKENGFTGLYSDGCGCIIDGLAPCGTVDADCKAGYRRDCEECELVDHKTGEGCICGEGMGDGCTSSNKPPAKAEEGQASLQQSHGGQSVTQPAPNCEDTTSPC